MTDNTTHTHAGQCPRCARKVLAPQHKKCMYCGARLPNELTLSEADAQAVIREKNERWRSEREAADLARAQREQRNKRHSKDQASEAEFLLGVMAEHRAKQNPPATTDNTGQETDNADQETGENR